MKKIIFAVLFLITGIVGNIYAETGLTANASPVTVEVTYASPTQEITFPFVARSVIVMNYDPTDGLWINFRGGDTKGRSSNSISDRVYVGPSSTLNLNDFLTSNITAIFDNTFTSGGASPVQVIGIY